MEGAELRHAHRRSLLSIRCGLSNCHYVLPIHLDMFNWLDPSSFTHNWPSFIVPHFGIDEQKKKKKNDRTNTFACLNDVTSKVTLITLSRCFLSWNWALRSQHGFRAVNARRSVRRALAGWIAIVNCIIDLFLSPHRDEVHISSFTIIKSPQLVFSGH